MAVDSRVPDHEELRARLSDALADRYDLEALVGSGASAFVYRARDVRHDRPVAIKVLRPDRTDSTSTQRFLKELDTSVHLEDPNIVQVFDSGEAAGVPFYVMPFFDGAESLEERLERLGALPLGDALRIIRDVGEALAFAHEHGVLHRDVKPGNILLVGGRALLTDFGVARALSAATTTGMTAHGFAVGTPAYMSPEQAAGESGIDARSDQYGLACVLHEMLAGAPVFEGETASGVARKHLTADPPRLGLVRPGTPKAVEDAVLRALSKSPDDRFTAVQDFVGALEQTPEHGAGMWRRSRVTGVVAAVFLGLGAWWAYDRMRGGPSWEGVPSSIAVMAFASPGASREERALTMELAERIERDLNWWDSTNAVSSSALSGEAHDMGIGSPPFEGTESALQLARHARTQAMLSISVTLVGDSALADATLYDVRSGDPISRLHSSTWDTGSMQDLVDPIVVTVLALDEGIDLRRGTANREALSAEFRGWQAFLDGRLDSAEAHFARAVGQDSTWAVALHRLALVQYWRQIEADRTAGELDLDAGVTRWSTLSMAAADGLPERERLHISGLYRLQREEYEGARADFRRLVTLAPTDVVAWLMLGTVELHDRSLVIDDSLPPHPAGSLSLAMDAFGKAVEFRRTFELGYLMAWRLYLLVQDAIDRAACDGFAEAGADLHSVVGLSEAAFRTPYCPAALGDSLGWVTVRRFQEIPPDSLQGGADRLRRRLVRDLESWAAFAPASPAPLHSLAEVKLAERRRRGVAPPEQLASLAREALGYQNMAYSLQTDTLAGDLIRLANLHLASGELEEATATVQRALHGYADFERTLPPLEAANVPMAAGQPSIAVEVAGGDNTESGFETTDGAILPLMGVRRVMTAIRVLGATGVQGEVLANVLERVDSLWNAAGYTPSEKEDLRAGLAMSVGAGLVLDPATLSRWTASTSHDDPLWEALIELAAGESGGAVRWTDMDVKAASTSLPAADASFILGLLAAQRGDPSTALRLYSRLDSLPHRVESFDRGWGLRSLSLHLRALELEKLGRLVEAADYEEQFLRAWTEPDPLNQLLWSEALRLRTRVSLR